MGTCTYIVDEDSGGTCTYIVDEDSGGTCTYIVDEDSGGTCNSSLPMLHVIHSVYKDFKCSGE